MILTIQILPFLGVSASQEPKLRWSRFHGFRFRDSVHQYSAIEPTGNLHILRFGYHVVLLLSHSSNLVDTS
jgi:hypothetical protein